MAQVRLSIGGRGYDLPCRAGEEAHLERLAARLDAKTTQAGGSVGTVNEARLLLFAGLLLADELEAGGTASDPGIDDAALADAVEAMAERLERLARRLENGGASA